MNTLGIMKKLCSKHFVNELFLLVTLTLMFVFTNIVTAPFQAFLDRRGELRRGGWVDYNRALHFSPSLALDFALFPSDIDDEAEYHPEMHETIRAHEGTAAVLEFYDSRVSAKIDKSTYDIDLLLYSQKAAEYAPIDAEGFTARTRDGRLPVAVSATTARTLPVGTEFETTFYLDVTGKSIDIPCVVAGVLSTDGVIPVAGSVVEPYASLNNIGTLLRETARADFMAAVYDPELFGDIMWDYAALIVPEEGTDVDEWRASLQKELGDWGTLHSLPEIEGLALKGTLSENLGEQLDFILLVLIAVFGFGAYLFLSVRQRERRLAILYIVGMTRGRMFALNMLFDLGLYLASAVAGGLLTPPVARYIVESPDLGGPGGLGALCAGGLFLLTALMSTAAALLQSARSAAITLYHRGD